MARSAIMHAFLRAFRVVRTANRTGTPVRELEERQAEERRRARLHRRQVLELGAASASLAACHLTTQEVPSPVDAAARSEIVIVGGGLAGLVCAYRLRDAGVSLTLYEAQAELGGRVRTDRETFEGQHCELGGELIDTTHPTMLGLARELGVELFDYRDDDLDARWVGHFDGERVQGADLEADLTALVEKVTLARRALWLPEDGVSRANPNGGAALDTLSIAQWLDRAGFAQGRLRKLIDAAYTTEFGLELQDSNALNLVLMLDPDQPEQLYGASDERFHAKSGNATFVEKLAEALPEGTVVTNSALVAVRARADGRLLLTFDQDGATVEASARHLVLALPFSTLRRVDIAPELLPEIKRRAIEETGYGQNTKVIVGFDARPWRAAGSSGETFTDLYQSSWDTSRFQPGLGGIVTNFLGGQRAIDAKDSASEAAQQMFLEGFDTVFPGAKARATGKGLVAYWPGNPWARGSYSAPRVGELTAIGGEAGTAVANIHFAGEHTSRSASGFMEGAAESGERVALEITTALGAPSTAPAARRLALAPR